MTFLRSMRGSLFRKYAVFLTLAVCIGLLGDGLSDIYFSNRELNVHLAEVQREQAASIAWRTGQFFREIEGHLGWLSAPPSGGNLPRLRVEVQRLLRQVPSISDVRVLDAHGHERLYVSRFEADRLHSRTDWSSNAAFRQAREGTLSYGDVYFRRETEPYLTIALPESKPGVGIILADVHLKAVWDVVSGTRIGENGYGYAVDRNGTLVAHPDSSLVQRKMNVRSLPQVQAALAGFDPSSGERAKRVTGTNLDGTEVLSTHIRIPQLNWIVFVEQPQAEANAPIREWIARSLFIMAGGLILAFLVSIRLARAMVKPIEALRLGAERLGRGEMSHRIAASSDELDAVARQFNAMAERLQESYAGLERKVEERTRELAVANRAKSRFLAGASHDLRQPVHAIGLLLSSLRSGSDPAAMRETIARAGAACDAMTELLDSLLDISRLDSGVVQPDLRAFPLSTILQRIEFDFEPEARAKGIDLRVVGTTLSTRSDPVMLRRVLFNLVSNAIRYTPRGKVLVVCRRMRDRIRIQVFDTGVGIAASEQEAVFEEFFQVSQAAGSPGLGLGLSIVRRLCETLGHRLDLKSVAGRGTAFTVWVPLAAAPLAKTAGREVRMHDIDGLAGRSVLVVDDDGEMLDTTRALLASWGCHVLTAESAHQARAELAAQRTPVDVIICDYALRGGKDGVHTVKSLGDIAGAAVVMLLTAVTDAAVVEAVTAAGYATLHKPVKPARLRSLMSYLLTPAIRRSRRAAAS
jgi:signal transduction histidine kinase/ActR/RegA family two-component response regulator